MGYHIHLKLREREDIMMVRRDGRGVSEVARAIARGKSTVLRELSALLAPDQISHLESSKNSQSPVNLKQPLRRRRSYTGIRQYASG